MKDQRNENQARLMENIFLNLSLEQYIIKHIFVLFLIFFNFITKLIKTKEKVGSIAHGYFAIF